MESRVRYYYPLLTVSWGLFLIPMIEKLLEGRRQVVVILSTRPTTGLLLLHGDLGGVVA